MKKNNLNNLFKDKDFYKDLSILKDLLSPLELRRDLLIEHLHIIQDHFGFLSEKNLILLAKLVKISSVEVYEVASFYAHFDIVKDGELAPPKTTIRVCNSLSCELFGSKELESNLAKNYKGQDVRVLKAPCMGRCSSAPVLEIGHYHIENASLEKVDQAIKNNWIKPDIPNYETFENYIEKGGYKKLYEIRSGKENWYENIVKADLRGLGGAGFRTAKKWELVSKETGPRYLAVNGDEGEPGTFKDKHYLETEPHMFLEGVLMA